MHGRHLLLIAVGGATGTAARWLALSVSGHLGESAIVLVLNVAGSAFIGFLAGTRFGPHQTKNHPAWSAVAVGFCGGLTTFATFSVQIAERIENGSASSGAGLLAVTSALTIAAVTLGFVAATRLQPGRPIR